jgi:hypothetical protein
VPSKEIPKSLPGTECCYVSTLFSHAKKEWKGGKRTHTHVKELQYNGPYSTKYWQVNIMPQHNINHYF